MSDKPRMRGDGWAHDRADALLAMIEQLQVRDVLQKSEALGQDIYSRIAFDDPSGEQRLIKVVLAGRNPVVLAATVELMVITGRLVEIEPGELWCSRLRSEGTKNDSEA